MPEVSKQALELLDVMVSEDFNYPLESFLEIGQLGKELLYSGCVASGMKLKPFTFSTSPKKYLQAIAILVFGRPPGDVDYAYFLEPTQKGMDYLCEHRKELLSHEAIKLLADMVCNEETPLFENRKSWSPEHELLGAGYAETYTEIVREFPPIPDLGFFYGSEPRINIPMPITDSFLRPTREGVVYLTENIDELFELLRPIQPRT